MSDLRLSILITAQNAASSVIQSLAKDIGGAKATLTGFAAGALGAMVGFGVASVHAAADFQSSMSKVQAYAGMTQKETEDMGHSILDLAPQLGEAPKALADSLYFVASAGFKGADALQILKYAGMTAAASNTDATVTTSALVGSLNALGLSASHAGNVSDLLNGVVKNGILTWQQYGSVVGKLAGSVSAAGGSSVQMQKNFVDLNAALDVYSNSTISAHQASQWLNADMNILYGKVGTLEKNASKLGISFNTTAFQSMDFAQKLQYLNAITDGNRQELTKLLGGNSTVATSVQFLNNHYGTLNSTIQSINGTMQHGQTTQEMFAVAQQDLNLQLARAQASFQALMITIGSQLIPVITPLVARVSDAVQAFSNWVGTGDNFKELLPYILGGLAGLATIIVATVIPAMASAAIATVAATWPLLLIAGAIAGVVIAFKHFYDVNAGFRSLVNGMASSLRDQLGGAFAYVQRQANEQTLRMKIDSINQILEMKQGVVAQIAAQRDQIAQLILHTHNTVTRHMLIMKLEALDSSLKQAQGVVKHMEMQRIGVQQQLELMDPVAHLHMLTMKDQSLTDVIQMKQGISEHLVQLKMRVDAELRATKDPVIRHMLEMKDRSITASLQQADGVIRNATKQRTGVEQQIKQLRGQIDTENGNIFVRMLHTWDQIRNGVGQAMSHLGSGFQKYIMPFLRDIGSFLATTFIPVWKQLQDVWSSQILPLLQQLWGAVQPLLPVLKAIGGIIAAVVIVAFGILMGILKGFISMVAVWIHDLGSFIGGIVQFFTGVYQVASGIVRFIVDLVTGNFGKLGSDLGAIWQGILNMFGGTFQAIGSLFHAFFGGIFAYVWNFIQGVIHFFQMLADHLVGHSIIPDMIGAIVGFFASLPGRIVGFLAGLVSKALAFFGHLKDQAIMEVQRLWAAAVFIFQNAWGNISGALGSLWTNITGWFNNLLSQFLTWGGQLIANLAHGILGGIGSAIGGAMSAVGSFIHVHLPHSPAKRGPLRDLPTQSAMIARQIAEGIESGKPRIQAALNTTLSPLATIVHSPGGGATSSHTSGPTNITLNISTMASDPNAVARIVMDQLSRQLNRSGTLTSWASGGRAV